MTNKKASATLVTVHISTNLYIRDWSKSIGGGGGGPEQRGGGSWGFEPCARGGSCNLQLP